MRISCFKHLPFEGPAAIARWAWARGHALACGELKSEQPLPILFQILHHLTRDV
ncbi:MAG TPA: hypothetical protein VJ952_08840 [Opitutales bacterium]|nr:hypothetical protein [Opitutales bacterium]